MVKHNHYLVELKQQVAKEYLCGESTTLELCKKCGVMDIQRIHRCK